jgi:Phosphotransferase enzyme family
MAVQTQPDRAQYRLIITRRRAIEILVSKRFSGSALPCIEVLAHARLAAQLVAGAKQKCNLDTYCLSIGSLPALREDPCPDKFALMEAVRQDDPVPPNVTWISSIEAVSGDVLLPTDQLAVRSSLEDLDRHAASPEAGPFARSGWIKELFRWVCNQIDPLGLSPTGAFEQLNASPTFNLMRIETTGAAVWFKATGQPNKRELGISVALDRLFPGHVPRVLGVHPIWNGWLSEELKGPALDDSADVRVWAGAARALADLQIAAISRTEALLESGCRDLSLHQLVDQIKPFLARVRELMALQTKQSPQILNNSEIGALGERLNDALNELHKRRIPATLGHLDPNPRNIIAAPNRYGFLDWAEGSVTHPFFTFEYLCEHARRAFAEPDSVAERLAAAYIEPWQSFFSSESIKQAMSISPLLAVYACALNTNAHSPEAFRNPARAGYFRSLARRAHREAEKLATRSDRCLA